MIASFGGDSSRLRFFLGKEEQHTWKETDKMNKILNTSITTKFLLKSLSDYRSREKRNTIS